MKVLIITFSLLFLSSCGTTKSMYAETKLQVCRDACDLKYSKYDYKGLSECRVKCQKKFSSDVK